MIDIPLIEIERFAIHDGPGIRSVVFLKGCPLHCPWCANPESQNFAPEQICRNNVMQWVGQPVSDDYVMATLERDADYYIQSGGGVTLSGGEALAHKAASLHLLSRCKEHGWHTAVETCGAVAEDTVMSVMPYTDLFLFDIKHTDAGQLHAATGASLDLVMRNLRHIARSGTQVILRLPCIPGYNITQEHFHKVYVMAAELGISRIDLLPYHVLGMEKYRQLGRTCPYPVTQGISPDMLLPYKLMGTDMGLDVRTGG